MTGVVYNQFALIDSSAVIALAEPTDQFHQDAREFFKQDHGFVWFTVNTTAHETFTRIRYDTGLPDALDRFDFLRTDRFRVLEFDSQDEKNARTLLAKYHDQRFSFHDALCATVMLRSSIFRIFSFDSDFSTLGFVVMPGRTA